MSEQNRKERVLKNVSSQMLASLLQSILGFIARKVFLDCLGDSLLGLNSLLTSIIGMLSIAELGITEAINFSLYEPLAKDDRKTVAAIMRLYRKLYSGIGATIALFGVGVLPFLRLMVDEGLSMHSVYIAYGLVLLNSVLSYFIAYKRNIISADQKDYIVTNADTVAHLIMSVVQIVLLITTKNYVFYLVTQVVLTVARNIYLTRRATKMYPYLQSEEPYALPKEYIQKLIANVKALFSIRIAVFCVSGTDNMLLSGFGSLSSVAIYNNYVTVMNLLNKTFNTIFGKANSVVGNFLVMKGENEVYTLFKRIFFVNFVITSYTSIGTFVVCNEVIAVWMGETQIWSSGLLALLVFNNYSRYILQTCEAFRSAAGLYSPRPFVKFLALAEGLLNLVASVVLAVVMENKPAAIFLGTAISTLVSTIGVPWIVYRFLFRRPLREFFGVYFKYFAIMLMALFASDLVFQQLCTNNHLINVFLGIAVCTIVTGAVYLVVFARTDEFKYNLGIALGFAKKVLRRRHRDK